MIFCFASGVFGDEGPELPVGEFKEVLVERVWKLGSRPAGGLGPGSFFAIDFPMGDLLAGEGFLGMKDRGSVADQCLPAGLSGRLDLGLDLKDFGNAWLGPVLAIAGNPDLLNLTVPPTGLRFSKEGALNPGTFSRFPMASGLWVQC